jgi:hypothetical protein
MYRQAEMQEYQDAIRKMVCSQCVEKPAGGPPCEPLGRRCGFELQLPELLQAIHEVKGPSIELYLNNIQRRFCAQCRLPSVDCCPCPVDYLLVLAVQAVKSVDRDWDENVTAEPLPADRSEEEDPFEGYPASFLDRLENEHGD